jgi:ATP-dependent DNA helicase RecG
MVDKRSHALNDKQKGNKIANLLTNPRRKGRIRNTGSRRHRSKACRMKARPARD